jgi:leucyl aminopeptidase (aminopeptidase T)
MIEAMPDLGPAVTTVIRKCLAVKANEDVLVIADPASRRLGEALKQGATEAGADATLAIMDERATDGTEPTRPIAAAMSECDVFIAPTTRSLSHTRARTRATDGGARGATLPGITEDMLARTMTVDFETMAARSQALAELLGQADTAHVSCPLGTDLQLELSGRTGIADDGNLSNAGSFGNLPAGEGFISPRRGEGTIIASSLASLGLTSEPAQLVVKDGQVVAAEGGLGPRYYERLDAHGDLGRNLAELGVGTNEAARLTGNVLEDEKILGTVHVAFGASAGIGGMVSVPIHLDVVVLDASLRIGDTQVLDAGRFVLAG